MYWRVLKVKALRDYRLALTYKGDKIRIFDVKPYLDFGIFKALNDVNLFNRVKVSFGTVEWPGEIDLAPELLYEDSIPNPKRKPAKPYRYPKTAQKAPGDCSIGID